MEGTAVGVGAGTLARGASRARVEWMLGVMVWLCEMVIAAGPDPVERALVEHMLRSVKVARGWLKRARSTSPRQAADRRVRSRSERP